MKRRDLLKSLFGVVAGLVTVPSLCKSGSKFSTEDYGGLKWADGWKTEFDKQAQYPLGTRIGNKIYVKAGGDINCGDAVFYVDDKCF